MRLLRLLHSLKPFHSALFTLTVYVLSPSFPVFNLRLNPSPSPILASSISDRTQKIVKKATKEKKINRRNHLHMKDIRRRRSYLVGETHMMSAKTKDVVANSEDPWLQQNKRESDVSCQKHTTSTTTSDDNCGGGERKSRSRVGCRLAAERDEVTKKVGTWKKKKKKLEKRKKKKHISVHSNLKPTR